jgi:hypothetical protein
LASIRRRHHRTFNQPEKSVQSTSCPFLAFVYLSSWAENPAEAPEVKPRLAMLHPGRTVGDIPL